MHSLYHRHTFTLSIGTLLLLLVLTKPAVAQVPTGKIVGGREVLAGTWEGYPVEFLAGVITLRLEEDASAADLAGLLGTYQGEFIYNVDVTRWGQVEVPDSLDLFDVIAAFQASPHVLYARPSLVVEVNHAASNGLSGSSAPGIPYASGVLTGPPIVNDPYYLGTGVGYPHQWSLNNTGQVPPGGAPDADIDAPEAWRLTDGEPAVVMIVLDSGIPLDEQTEELVHPDLCCEDRYLLGRIIADGETSLRDDLGHGTHVTGILGAVTNNGTGIAGVGWRNRVLVYQIFTDGVSTPDWIAQGIVLSGNGTGLLTDFAGCIGCEALRSTFALSNSVVEDATGVGIHARHTNGEITHTEIEGSGSHGVLVEDADVAKFRNNEVTGNGHSPGPGGTVTAGLAVASNGDLSLGNTSGGLTFDPWGYNVVHDNAMHETGVTAGGTLLIGIEDVAGGQNTIRKAGGPGGVNARYVANGSGTTVRAEEVWWGVHPPPPGAFAGVVDRDPALECDWEVDPPPCGAGRLASTGAELAGTASSTRGGVGAVNGNAGAEWLRQEIRATRAALARAPAPRRPPRRCSRWPTSSGSTARTPSASTPRRGR